MNQGIIIRNIRGIVLCGGEYFAPVPGNRMPTIPVLGNAWLKIEGGIIRDFGTMDNTTGIDRPNAALTLDATGKYVLPAFCDSHTHLVYAGSREQEFVDKLRGLSYEEIARRGGGILNSAKRLRSTPEEELYRQAYIRINEIMRCGTGAVEIKSGYGLTVEDELKMLRVICRLRDTIPLTVKSTFLGAHAVPEEYNNNREAYVDLIINEMIPAVAYENLADYIDVFCDKGFFSPDDTARILMAGIKYGLRPKIHANELDFSGGVQTGVSYDAVSVDHLEHTGEEEIRLLKDSDTIPVLLPGVSFFLGLPDPPVQRMLEEGLPVALASDYNPGSSPSGNMKTMISLACIRWKMLPAEAITAATMNGACAMDLGGELGSIDRGKKANLIITKPMPSVDFFPYAFGSDLIDKVIIGGEIVK